MMAGGADALEALPGSSARSPATPSATCTTISCLTANQIAYLREVLTETINVLLNQMAGA